MEDTEANNVSVETLSQQYETVKQKTYLSPVEKFGDLSFMDEPIGDFEGTCSNDATATDTLIQKAQHYYKQALSKYEGNKSHSVDSRDHDLHYAYQRVIGEGTHEAYLAMELEIAHRQFSDKLFAMHFGDLAEATEQPQDYDCL